MARTLTCSRDIRATRGGRSRAIATAIVGTGLAAIIQQLLGERASLIWEKEVGA